jgi:hypothetical protein
LLRQAAAAEEAAAARQERGRPPPGGQADRHAQRGRRRPRVRSRRSSAREKERRAHYAGQQHQREKQVRDVIARSDHGAPGNRMAEKAADLVKALFKMGMMVTINQTIDQDTAELLVTNSATTSSASTKAMSISIPPPTSMRMKR